MTIKDMDGKSLFPEKENFKIYFGVILIKLTGSLPVAVCNAAV